MLKKVSTHVSVAALVVVSISLLWFGSLVTMDILSYLTPY